MSRRLKAAKNMAELSQQDLEDLTTAMGNANVRAAKKILAENRETLGQMATQNAVLSQDADSKFCKNCGKEQ